MHTHTSLHNHKQLWNKYLEFRNAIEKDGDYPEITGTDTALMCSPPNQCPPPWQQQGWKGSSPPQLLSSLKDEVTGGDFFFKLAQKQTYRTRNGCSHLYSKEWKSQQVFLTKKWRNILDYVWTVWLYTLQKQIIRENYQFLETKQKSALNLVS